MTGKRISVVSGILSVNGGNGGVAVNASGDGGGGN